MEGDGDASFRRRCTAASPRLLFRIHWIVILMALILLCQFAEHVDGRHHSHEKKHRHCVKRSRRDFAKDSPRTSGSGVEDPTDGRRLLPSDFEFVNLLPNVTPKIKALLEPERLAKILPESFTFDGQLTFKAKTLHLLRELMRLNADARMEIEELLRQVEAYRDAPDITRNDLAPLLRVLTVVRIPHLRLVRRYLEPHRLIKLLPGNFDVKKTANATVELHDVAILLNITLGSAKSKKLKTALEALISELETKDLNVMSKEDENGTGATIKTKWMIRPLLTSSIKVPVNKIRVKYKIIKNGNSTKSEDASSRRMKPNILGGSNSITSAETQITKSSPVSLDKSITSSSVDLSQRTKPSSYLLGNNSIIFKKRITKLLPLSSEKLSSEQPSTKSRHRTHYVKSKNRRILFQPNITVNVEYDYSDDDASLIKMLQDKENFSLIEGITTGELERTDTQTKNTVKKDLSAKRQKSNMKQPKILE